MTCCSPVNSDTGRLFSRFAELNRLRLRWLGPESTQRQLIEGMREAGLDGAELLEIGCGTGYLHRVLLQMGAARATGVDLSDKMLAIARTEAEAAGLGTLVEGLLRAGQRPERSRPFTPGEAPYPGLAPLTTDQAALFFGRGEEIRRLRNLIAQRSGGVMVAVTGPSGVGKTSLVHAGLVPSLTTHIGQWLIAGLRLTASPLEAASFALAGAGVEVSSGQLGSDRMSLSLALQKAMSAGKHDASLIAVERKVSCTRFG